MDLKRLPFFITQKNAVFRTFISNRIHFLKMFKLLLSSFLPRPELQLGPPDPAGPRAVGQVQRARHQVHYQGGGVRQASARLHRPDHRRPDHSAQNRLPGHPGTCVCVCVCVCICAPCSSTCRRSQVFLLATTQDCLELR